jgi:hypothetical protein
MSYPNARQMSALRAVAADGGFSAHLSNDGVAEECVWFGWLVYEGPTGFGLTVDGAAISRPAPIAPVND